MSKDLYDCGILSIIDRAILAAYCTAWSRWVDAELALRASKVRDETGNFGLLIEGRKGMVVNPLVGAANRTLIIVSRLCAELGMTPELQVPRLRPLGSRRGGPGVQVHRLMTMAGRDKVLSLAAARNRRSRARRRRL